MREENQGDDRRQYATVVAREIQTKKCGTAERRHETRLHTHAYDSGVYWRVVHAHDPLGILTVVDDASNNEWAKGDVNKTAAADNEYSGEVVELGWGEVLVQKEDGTGACSSVRLIGRT